MRQPKIYGENTVQLKRTVFFVKKIKIFELSVMIGVLVTIVWCAATPHLTTQWWTTAFAPLCDGILTADWNGEGIVLRSKIWELLQQYLF